MLLLLRYDVVFGFAKNVEGKFSNFLRSEIIEERIKKIGPVASARHLTAMRTQLLLEES